MWTTATDEVECDFETLDNEPTTFGAEDTTSSGLSTSLLLVRYIISFIMHLRMEYYLSDILAHKLLKFFKILFGILGMVSPPCKYIANHLPSSLYKLNQKFQFRQYVVWKRCHGIYYFEQCVTRGTGHRTGKVCPYVQFPFHPHARKRLPCNTPLLKTVHVAGGKTVLYPFMSYCYLSLTTSLQAMLLRPSCVNFGEQKQK